MPETTISGKEIVKNCEEISLNLGFFANDGKRALKINNWSVITTVKDQDLSEINTELAKIKE